MYDLILAALVSVGILVVFRIFLLVDMYLSGWFGRRDDDPE